MNNIIYGVHAVSHRLQVGSETINEFLIQKHRTYNSKITKLIQSAKLSGVVVKYAERDELDKITDNAVHQGLILYINEEINVFTQQDLPNLLKEINGKKLILVLDNIQDPQNFGACLRTAESAGVDLVIFPKDKSASLTATTLKVACGAAEHLKIVGVTNLSRSLEVLKKHSVWIYGLSGETTKNIYTIDGDDDIAIVMGSEGSGLRYNTIKQCDFLVNIPMFGQISSLNVSVATGVALYEVTRQRNINEV